MNSLAAKHRGFLGTVDSLVGDNVLVERLAELGIVPGANVCVKGMVGFGSLVIVEVRGTRVALRKSEANCVWF